MGGINVPIDRIVPLTDARDNFSRIVADIESSADGLYVLTKGGKPAIALISIGYLEKLMDGKGNVAEPLKPASPRIAQSPPVEKSEEIKTTPPSPPPLIKPKIDPSWTGRESDTKQDGGEVKKPISPWPIISPKPDLPKNDAGSQAAPPISPAAINNKPSISKDAATASAPPINSPPPAPISPDSNRTPTTAPVNKTPLPPPPPNLTSNPFVANQPAPSPSTPLPKAQNQIQFDEPPKTSPEPGEPLPPVPAPPTPKTTDPNNKPAEQTPPPAAPSPPTSPVQDIEI